MAITANLSIRCINVGNVACDHPPFAINTEFIPKHLPFDTEDLDPSLSTIPTDDTVGIFGREAQACLLFDRTVSFCDLKAAAQSGSLDDQKVELDHDLWHRMGLFIDQNGGNACGHCESSAIVLS